MERTKGIDVSHHQGTVDFAKVKASGIGFAMLRAGYGWENWPKQTDRMFYRNYKNATAAGLPCGAYHYSYAKTVRDAQKEADFFLNLIKGCRLAYPVAFDLEDPTQAGLGRTALTGIADAFCRKVEQAGYYVCLYTNPDWMKNRLDMKCLSRYDLWIARYGTEPAAGTAGMWQYTSAGKVDGVTTRVDMNIAYRDYPRLMRKAGLNGFSKG